MNTGTALGKGANASSGFGEQLQDVFLRHAGSDGDPLLHQGLRRSGTCSPDVDPHRMEVSWPG